MLGVAALVYFLSISLSLSLSLKLNPIIALVTGLTPIPY